MKTGELENILMPLIASENHPSDIIDSSGNFIARCIDLSSAKLLVSSANSVGPLISAGLELMERFKRLEKRFGEVAGIKYDCRNGSIERMEKAIAQAEGGA